MAAPGTRHWPDGEDFLDVALTAVRADRAAGSPVILERMEVAPSLLRGRCKEGLEAVFLDDPLSR
ncbi:hypothetical protein [Streptomyces sp. NPDC088261]|uniref:hypothetical protein n=1 Tax=Streptomyces sp. NPDC088261 TaxID=3365851 RepID=UPI003804B054